MKKFVAVAITCVFLSLCALAQQPNVSTNNHPMIAEREQNTCSGDHKRGERIACSVIFDGNPELDSVQLLFQLQGAVPEQQVGMPQSFWLTNFQKVTPGTFEVSGQLSDCVRGPYEAVILRVYMHGVVRDYQLGAAFKDVLGIKILNDVDLHFPKLKDLSAEPPKEEKAAVVPVKK